MASVESRTHSFVVRIWLEEEPGESEGGLWRGHITHVEEETQQYLHNLAEIPAYIAPYLTAWGIKLKLCLRVALWLGRHC